MENTIKLSNNFNFNIVRKTSNRSQNRPAYSTTGLFKPRKICELLLLVLQNSAMLAIASIHKRTASNEDMAEIFFLGKGKEII